MERAHWPSAVCALFVLAGSAAGTQFGPRDDLGVAALDARTGEVRWEAWEKGEVPAGAPAGAADAVGRLLAARWVQTVGDRWDVGKDREITSTESPTGERDGLGLYRKAEEGRARVLLRRYASDKYPWPAGWLGDLLLVREQNDAIVALRVEDGGPEWKPAWAFRPWGANGPGRFVRVQAAAELAWVSSHERVTALDAGGRITFDARIADPWAKAPYDFDPGVKVVVGKGTVYLTTGSGLVALERATGRESWRRLTHRFPNHPAVEEVDATTVLVQVGSDCPPALVGALLTKRRAPTMRVRPPVARAEAAAVLVRAYGDGWSRRYLREWIEENAGGAAADEADLARAEAARRAAEAMRGLLKDWPARRDEGRLLERTVAALAPAPGEAPSPPAGERDLLWAVLQDRAYRWVSGQWPHVPFQAEPASPAWPAGAAERLLGECRRVLREPPADATRAAEATLRERARAASLIATPALAARLGREELDTLVLDAQAQVWQWAALAVERGGERARLIGLARKRPEADWDLVAGVLLTRLPAQPDQAERRFWADYAERSPAGAAQIAGLPGAPSVLAEVTVGPVRRYLEREVARPTERWADGDRGIAAAVGFLAKRGKPEDTPLLRSLLAHPGYCVVETSARRNGKWVGRKVYVARMAAAEALRQRGEAVPADLVTEEEVLVP